MPAPKKVSFSQREVYLSSNAFLTFFSARHEVSLFTDTNMSRKRFNNLDAALKYLRPQGANESTVIPDAPANTQLRLYQDYKAKKRVVTYTRAASSNPGDLTSASLQPFALPSTNTEKFLVQVSQRAISNFAASSLSVALLNIDTTPEGTNGLKRVLGFTPARATVSNVTGGSGTPTPSKITGNSYKKKAAASYTYPFGRSTDKPVYSQVKADILQAVSGATGNKGVSFKPELFR